MNKIHFYFLLILFSGNLYSQSNQYDLIIVGGTPGGIMTAIAAARQGKKSVILERSSRIGGLPANGLGATDISTRGATTGLFKEFVDGVLLYYTQIYGNDSKQVSDCSEGYHFEPHVASIVFQKMIEPEKRNITILTMRQFDISPKNIKIEDGIIKNIRVYNRITKRQEEYAAKIFVDATYEGDLGAAANVPFSIGREGKDEYNEIGAGRVFKLWEGPELDGSTHESDKAVQAYNYRLCLTNNPKNRILPSKPKHYNRSEYLSLIDDVYLGRYAGIGILSVTKEMQEANRKFILDSCKTQIPGDPWGIDKITNMVTLPNMKTDANNQHLALISTDLPEENWKWPTADWKWRDKFAERLKEYTLGLLWFAQNDKALPAAFRNSCREWGLAKDEYQDNDNFPRQIYVREGRRLQGQHLFTANDARPKDKAQRPPLYLSSITASHYNLDSHAVHKRENGQIALDGFVSYSTAPYTVPFGVILPQNIKNLLIPVPASATHIGFSTLRMEPCWMALGQAAGVAASVAIDQDLPLQKITIQDVQELLIKENATLIYYKDIQVDSPDFELVQHMGIRGYLPTWEANLDSVLDKQTARDWSIISGIQINAQNKTRKDVLKSIYTLIK